MLIVNNTLTIKNKNKQLLNINIKFELQLYSRKTENIDIIFMSTKIISSFFYKLITQVKYFTLLKITFKFTS